MDIFAITSKLAADKSVVFRHFLIIVNFSKPVAVSTPVALFISVYSSNVCDDEYVVSASQISWYSVFPCQMLLCQVKQRKTQLWLQSVLIQC